MQVRNEGHAWRKYGGYIANAQFGGPVREWSTAKHIHNNRGIRSAQSKTCWIVRRSDFPIVSLRRVTGSRTDAHLWVFRDVSMAVWRRKCAHTFAHTFADAHGQAYSIVVEGGVSLRRGAHHNGTCHPVPSCTTEFSDTCRSLYCWCTWYGACAYICVYTHTCILRRIYMHTNRS